MYKRSLFSCRRHSLHKLNFSYPEVVVVVGAISRVCLPRLTNARKLRLNTQFTDWTLKGIGLYIYVISSILFVCGIHHSYASSHEQGRIK